MRTRKTEEVTTVFDDRVAAWLASDRSDEIRVRVIKRHPTFNPATGELIYLHLTLEAFLPSQHAQVVVAVNPMADPERWVVDQVKVHFFENGLYLVNPDGVSETLREEQAMVSLVVDPSSPFFLLGDLFAQEERLTTLLLATSSASG